MIGSGSFPIFNNAFSFNVFQEKTVYTKFRRVTGNKATFVFFLVREKFFLPVVAQNPGQIVQGMRDKYWRGGKGVVSLQCK